VTVQHISGINSIFQAECPWKIDKQREIRGITQSLLLFGLTINFIRLLGTDLRAINQFGTFQIKIWPYKRQVDVQDKSWTPCPR